MSLALPPFVASLRYSAFWQAAVTGLCRSCCLVSPFFEVAC